MSQLNPIRRSNSKLWRVKNHVDFYSKRFSQTNAQSFTKKIIKNTVLDNETLSLVPNAVYLGEFGEESLFPPIPQEHCDKRNFLSILRDGSNRSLVLFIRRLTSVVDTQISDTEEVPMEEGSETSETSTS
jgi:hypothetical protein